MSRTSCIAIFVLAVATPWPGEGATASGGQIPALPPATALVSRVTFVSFDTETTGLDARYDRIVEIGAVKFADGRVIETRQWLINPRQRIPYWATQVHGITMEMVRDAPEFKEAYPEFEEFARGCVLIAHNARFDVGFLKEECKRSRLPSPRLPVLDSLRLFRAWFPEAESHSLEPLAVHTGVEAGRFHRAVEDSVYVEKIFGLGLKRLGGQDPALERILDDAGDVLTW
ncbi:MAG: 3'-5' exonuclease [Kiritimatiellae bacterium]|nr:3'-5' exonuclease [Kiritimatiellia bacterium]